MAFKQISIECATIFIDFNNRVQTASLDKKNLVVNFPLNAFQSIRPFQFIVTYIYGGVFFKYDETRLFFIICEESVHNILTLVTH